MSPPRVSLAEGGLLDALRAVLAGSGLKCRTALRPRLDAPMLPPEMGPEAFALLQEDLRAGVARAMMHRGGWRRRSRVFDGRVFEGPLWEAAPKLELSFTEASHRLVWSLIGRAQPLVPESAGDELLFLLVADGLRRGGFPLHGLEASALVRLVFPLQVPTGAPSRGWGALSSREGTLVLEGLGAWLAERWAELAADKRRQRDPEIARTLAERQRSEVEAMQRAQVDPLAMSFLVESAERFAGWPAEAWVASLEPSASLGARSAAAEAEGRLLGAFAPLQLQYESWSRVPFFEPEYEVAQAGLRRWQGLGRAGFQALARSADALRSGRVELGSAAGLGPVDAGTDSL